MNAKDFREWRNALGYTQLEAAAKLGFTRVTVQNWERGRTRLPKFIELACLELTRQWKQCPEFGTVALVHSEKPFWPNPDDNTRQIFIECELFANNEIAIRQALRMSKTKNNFGHMLIIERGGDVLWDAPALVRECEIRKRKPTAKRKAVKIRSLIPSP